MEKNNTDISIAELKTDIKYIKEAVDNNKANVKKLFDTIDTFLQKTVDEKIREYAAPKLVGTIVYRAIGLILMGFVGALVTLII